MSMLNGHNLQTDASFNPTHYFGGIDISKRPKPPSGSGENAYIPLNQSLNNSTHALIGHVYPSIQDGFW